MKRIFSLLFVCLGILLIFLSIGKIGKNIYYDYLTVEESNKVLNVLNDNINKKSEIEIAKVVGKLPVVNVEDKGYIGIIRIPKYEIVLPILSDWNEENAKILPCRYVGNLDDEPLIIAGHNSSKQFNCLNKLSVGDIVQFVDNEGNVFDFEVYEKLIIDEYDVEQMVNTSYRLTLFTCTDDDSARVTIRCI